MEERNKKYLMQIRSFGQGIPGTKEMKKATAGNDA